ncbi:interleukin-20 receptor subunit alpha-like isoform X2 [Heterodontus francisci]|uniref:interleukin-20 receptor subunit alpha-like isoform X2 n=1 Tax=Heterodontus francisci TaxID=7792 RepID=UPI00355BDA8B
MKLRMRALLLLMFTLSGADTLLQPPGNLYFTSLNTENVFHWNPVQNYSQAIRYDVEYCRYGYNEKCIPVTHCTGISHHHCDLTQETWDFNVEIIARVRSVIGNATSEWERSEHFKPLDSTSLGLPSFNIKAEHNMIRISISPPTLHTRGRNRSMEELFGSLFMYIVYIRANNTDKPEELESSGELNKTEVKSGNTYCISVRAVVKGDPRQGNVTEEKCAAIPDPVLESSINIIFGVISAALILFTLCFCLGLSCWYYLKKQSTIPAVLKSLDKNKKCLSIMDYLSLIEDVVVQQVLADSSPISSTRIQEQDDLWPELKIKEASSVDSGIDIGSHFSDRLHALCEPLNPYMQQTPECSSHQCSSHQCSSPEGSQNHSQPQESCLINIPDTINTPDNGVGSITSSGYQRQTPRTNTTSEQDECSVPAQNDRGTSPCFISTPDSNITEGFAKGFLSLDDVMLTENGL